MHRLYISCYQLILIYSLSQTVAKCEQKQTPQVVGEIDGENHCARVIDECPCTGWLDESWDIFGVGNRQEHSRARTLVEGAPSFFGSGRCSDAIRYERGEAQKSNAPRGGRVPAQGGTERERESEKERERRGRRGRREAKNHLPAYVMLRVCRSRKEPLCERENRSSETRNRLSVR